MTPEFAATVQLLIVQTAPYLIAAVAAYLLKAGLEAWAQFKTQQPDAAAALENAAQMGVKAAEQTGLVKKLAQEAFDKKDFALKTAQDYLKAQGVNIDLHLIDAAIEAKVIELFPKAPTA